MKKIQWLRPKLVAQIEFTEWTKGSHLRHSRFVAIRDDKKAVEVVKIKEESNTSQISLHATRRALNLDATI